MSKWNKLTTLIGVVALTFVIVNINAPHSHGAGAAPVNIVSPLPLPVTGSTTVSGTIAATQSGVWNVNVATPLDANGNPTPLATLDAVQPYEDFCEGSFLQGLAGCNFHAVPSGKRLVIQEVDFHVSVETGLKPLEITFNTGSGVLHEFTATFMGTSTLLQPALDFFSMHQETRLYASQNTKPDCGIGTNGTSSNGSIRCVLSGFLVDLP